MIKFFVRILKFSGKYRGRVLSAALFAFIKGICIMMPLFLGFLLFNEFYEGTITVPRCLIYFAGMALSFAVHIISTNLSDRLQSTAGYKIFAEKRMELGAHLRQLPMGYFTAGNIGKISSVLSSDMVFVEENVMQSIADMLGNGFSALLMVAFMYVIDWRIGLLVTGVSLAVVIAAIFMNKSGVKHSNIRQQRNEELTDAVISHIEGIGVIKSYNLLGEKSEDLTKNFRKTRDAALKFEFTQLPWMVVLNVLYTVGMAGIVALGVWLYFENMMTLPYLIGCVLFAFSIFLPLKTLYSESSRLTVMGSCLDRIEGVFDEKTLPDNGKKHIPATGAPEISFENVTFAYGEEDTVHNVSFAAEKNTMTALVGPSGGGKTTLANLLARFWDIKSGSIKIRGVDIRDVPLSELMDKISMVFQRVYLFADTVYNNIAMGRPAATKEEVEEAARKARCYDFIMNLPQGFDTVIGEGGASLSGGEKQRISIARCILKDASIVILDEATASVDLDNERHIQEAITELVRGKTLLVIAHRLNTIRAADKYIFYYIDEIERAIEQGNKISFCYCYLTYKAERKYRKDRQRYIVNPLALVYSRENYYVVCYDNNHKGCANYRIDRIADLKIEPERIDQRADFENFNINTYRRQAFSMYNGELTEVQLTVHEDLIEEIFDKFGEKTKLCPQGEEYYTTVVSVQVSPAFFRWVIGSIGKIKIYSPRQIKEQFDAYVDKVKENY